MAVNPPGAAAQHPWLGLAAGRPGRVPQRGQVRDAGPVLPRAGLLHPRQQHDHRQQPRHQPGDAQVGIFANQTTCRL